MATIWIKLPFIGKKGCCLVRNCTRKISRLLNQPVKFVTHWQTVNASTFVSTKDPIPKPYKNSVVCQFTCPACCSSYIGKTDRCLYTCIKEHAKSDKSEICNHVHNCKKIQYVRTLLIFPATVLNKQLLDEVFVICRIINVEVRVIIDNFAYHKN